MSLGDKTQPPLDDDEFEVRLGRLGPFERRPLLAVAVSGGADSLALALLADRWARHRGGRSVALTVDHRLRAEATAEARQVGRWLKRHGVPHRVLTWEGPHPFRGIQAAARAARYALLEDWCEAQGCLHLLVAHHQADQAETFWLRLARGSGVDGLAGMPAVAPRRACRILRPLLEVPPARLRATLQAVGQPWVEDPSNDNPEYARVRLRRSAPLLQAEGLGAERLAATIARLGRARQALETATGELLARAARPHPAGFVWLDAGALAAAPAELGLRALAAVISTIGGEDYPPRLVRLERLYRDILEAGLGQGRTLGGCRVLLRREGVLICREPAALQPPVAAPPGEAVTWDGRFRARLAAKAPKGLTLGALGDDALHLPPALRVRLEALPVAARPALPVLRRGRRLAAVPLSNEEANTRNAIIGLWFRPLRPISPVGFTVV
ncbi:MAG TPA: tRNA lysidine(34) synthetase TilS [Stellaceae bacterium]|nr:tRNA lysidine(34) synthetase TilS [Stellaceae bacterium]